MGLASGKAVGDCLDCCYGKIPSLSLGAKLDKAEEASW